MKWVVLTIVLGLAAYTYLTLHFRKPGPAFQPYQDAVNRTTVSRLLSSGYQRIALAVERPADPQRTSVILSGYASATTASRGLPPELDPRGTKSLGLKLVNFLARHQLRAEITVLGDKGTMFIFRLNKPDNRP